MTAPDAGRAAPVQAGKVLRSARLFHPRSGRGVVVAMDHGIFGQPAGLEDLGRVLDELLALGPEGVLLNPGVLPRVAPRLASRGRPAVVVGLNTYVTTTLPQEAPKGQQHRALASLEQAVGWGADAVKLLLVFGDDDLTSFADNLAFVADTVEAAQRLGVPVMVEPTLWSYPGRAPRTPTARQLGDMMRIAVELGADILKVPLAAPFDAYRELVQRSPVPVMVLGGARSAGEQDVLEMARQAVEAGADGLVFGRNVWQHADPTRMLARLLEIVHGEARRA